MPDQLLQLDDKVAVVTGARRGVDAERAEMLEGAPLRRLGRPEEIAAAVLYFASPAYDRRTT